jgi:hypothetical protein
VNPNQVTNLVGTYGADTCDRAQPVELNTPVSGNNETASTDANVPRDTTNDGRDVWYTFTPTVTDRYEVSLCGSTFDTTLNVYQGVCGQLELLAGNDNDVQCSPSSRLCADLAGGQNYYIRVAGYGGTTGDYTLLVSDQCQEAETITPPTTLNGVANPTFGNEYGYSISGANSSLGHALEYRFDWGDGSALSAWSTSSTASHAWHSTGTMSITVHVRCQIHPEVGSSAMWTVTVANPNVPFVVGMQQSAAETLITNNDFTLGQVLWQCSSNATGTVINQTPSAGSSVAPGSSVNLTVSSGPCSEGEPEGEQEVVFADRNLEAYIRVAIGKPTGAIHGADLVNLTSIYAENYGIANLSGIEYCVNLTWLDLGYNQIADLRPLSSLGNLQRLSLEQNLVTDIGPLASLTGLTGVGLGHNQISTLNALAGLVNLVELGLSNNQINEIGPLLTNTGFGANARILLSGNPLSTQACADISVLQGRGVNVVHDDPCGDVVSEGEGEDMESAKWELIRFLQANVDAVDTNGDHLFSYAEVQTARPNLSQAVFNYVDTDGDGQISYYDIGYNPDPPSTGCLGCTAGKGNFVFDKLRKSFGDLFLGGLGLMVLLAFRNPRS